MKIQPLNISDDPRYPYHYRIEVPRDNHTLVDTVMDWVHETKFKCCIVPGAVYVPTEQGALLFVLRWS